MKLEVISQLIQKIESQNEKDLSYKKNTNIKTITEPFNLKFLTTQEKEVKYNKIEDKKIEEMTVKYKHQPVNDNI